MGQKVAGTCYIKVDGTQLTISGGVEAPLMNIKRETVLPGYFKETDKAPWLKLTALHTPDFPLKALTTGVDMTITCEFKNGKVYVLSGAYLVDEPGSKGEEGTIELKFDGNQGSWQ
ncbi:MULTISPECIES: phage tail tube protein [Pseudomonas]|uniref:Outer membrane receptor protein n=2 Tax=Pseudomonas TaxID=286 RepID=A0A3M3SH43_PSECI|nr:MULTISPECIES: phage tail tube protein [Pseudomonas]AHF69777.1 outer membrane receptor protein [Pseudomonas cichorii JBC1]MBN6716574.1 phage tail tube protein [Pseudomonas capsici]MBN6721542.1 phage tail tube protein [Pseudomonas capsici]MBN6726540.1 phage tail tube protein [Pseudomonas capsici]MBX8477587.1 phage tail tube protein [Pseudomonas cichorii]